VPQREQKTPDSCGATTGGVVCGTTRGFGVVGGIAVGWMAGGPSAGRGGGCAGVGGWAVAGVQGVGAGVGGTGGGVITGVGGVMIGCGGVMTGCGRGGSAVVGRGTGGAGVAVPELAVCPEAMDAGGTQPPPDVAGVGGLGVGSGFGAGAGSSMPTACLTRPTMPVGGGGGGSGTGSGGGGGGGSTRSPLHSRNVPQDAQNWSWSWLRLPHFLQMITRSRPRGAMVAAASPARTGPCCPAN